MAVDLEAWGTNDVPKAVWLVSSRARTGVVHALCTSQVVFKFMRPSFMWDSHSTNRQKYFINIFCEFKYLSKQISENTETVSVK